MKKILINCKPWETRVAITRDNSLQNVYFASHTSNHLERSFFKAVVTKVLPGIQTAFVDIGQEKAGFLHISEIDFSLAVSRMSDKLELDEDGNEKTPKRINQQSMDIGKILREGEEILVQVSKEPVYEKGAKLTRCFTLPGRFLVLMPNIPRIGISKKIESPEERSRLKDEIRKLLPPEMGAIIRTSAEDRSKKEIAKDVKYLLKNWNEILTGFKNVGKTELIYKDLPLSLQAIRDNLDDKTEVVITDSKDNQNEVIKFIKEIAPEYTHNVKLYNGPSTLFEFYDINRQINNALQKKVQLKSGGSIIIESAEAMTVVDVNTGKFTGKGNMEETILKTNLEAAVEIACQLRLRNIGGLIVIDFIDMQNHSSRQKLITTFEKALKEYDRFQSVVLKISEFGLVQMTRKRSGKTLVNQLMSTCPTCTGLGFIQSKRSLCYSILRNIEDEMPSHKDTVAITLRLHTDIFNYVTATEFDTVLDLEKKNNVNITLISDNTLSVNGYKIEK